MGLIKAGIGALGGTLADQWKEYFYCDSLAKDVLVVKGQKRTSGRSSNTKGNDNIISNGSVIAVADGQCMIIVEQGKIVEVCADPGEFTYDTSTEPSIFTGNLGESIKNTFRTIRSAEIQVKTREFTISTQRKLSTINSEHLILFRSGSWTVKSVLTLTFLYVAAVYIPIKSLIRFCSIQTYAVMSASLISVPKLIHS